MDLDGLTLQQLEDKARGRRYSYHFGLRVGIDRSDAKRELDEIQAKIRELKMKEQAEKTEDNPVMSQPTI